MKEVKKYVGMLAIIVLVGIYLFTNNDKVQNTVDQQNNLNNTISIYTEDIIKVHYIDVGQGDSTFIELPNKETMLIDAGERDYGEKVYTYINRIGYTDVDYVIGTHPHTDHIGGMYDVISNTDVSCIYMPDATSNTKTFQNLLTLIKNKKIDAKLGRAGVTVIDSDDLTVKMLAPTKDYEDLNNASIVLKITYKDISFLFTGDAESDSEKEFLKDAKCNVVKVGHHGSNTSSTAAFVYACDADYAIISVGKDNDYGHPKTKVVNRWKSSGAKIYRTDESGTIVVSSDGKNIEIKCEK